MSNLQLKFVSSEKDRAFKALGNAERPDRAGEYKMIMELFIDPNATEGRNILRPWGWTILVIVSEKYKGAVESVGSAGTV